jgi:hypothetical protein
MRILVALFMCSPVLAQTFSAGLRSGVVVPSGLAADGSQGVSALIGPAVEMTLSRGVGIELEFLVRRIGIPASAVPARAVAWQFETPSTFKYQFPAPAKPFMRAGISFNRIFAVSGATQCARGTSGDQFYCEGAIPIAELRHRSTLGFVAGGGIRFKINRLRLEPELRLTRWIDRNFGVRNSAVRSNLSEIGVLLGVMF